MFLFEGLFQFGHLLSCLVFWFGASCLGGFLLAPLLVELRSFVWRGLGEQVS